MILKQFNTDVPLLDFEKKILGPIYSRLHKLKKKGEKINRRDKNNFKELKQKLKTEAEHIYKNLNSWQRCQVARHPHRPYSLDYIQNIFTDFIELHGDRNFSDDKSMVCGIAALEGTHVVVVAEQKGRKTEEKLKRNFGMPQPEGYRKALRFFKFAEKFNKPVICFIDTAGAYPGLGGEERSQGEAIARNLKVMAGLQVPLLGLVIGEGGSGGALGIGVCNHVAMLENAIYSVISPESCASILWRDPAEKEKAAAALKNDAKTAYKFKVVDEIISEGIGGAHRDWQTTFKNVKTSLVKNLKKLQQLPPAQLRKERIRKYTMIGKVQMLTGK
ncbi:MAG TPA: acetyl-CoA carboxylase carboxyltransferase subunit alpha [Spirochaetota bacterium]|nr:acetyl-CoA carboxylase carboxyltransferase subunit alpha [Spirochaetota bacterium]